jgi:hypothetical protein
VVHAGIPHRGVQVANVAALGTGAARR